MISALTIERDKALSALSGATAKIASFEEQVAGLLAVRVGIATIASESTKPASPGQER